jgi:hypothetical protein
VLIEHLIYSTALAIFIGMIHYRFFNRDYSWIIIVSSYVPDLDIISDSLLKKMGIAVQIYGHLITHGDFTIRPNVPYIKIPLHTNSCIGGMDDTNGRARSGLQGSLGEKRSA